MTITPRGPVCAGHQVGPRPRPAWKKWCKSSTEPVRSTLSPPCQLMQRYLRCNSSPSCHTSVCTSIPALRTGLGVAFGQSTVPDCFNGSWWKSSGGALCLPPILELHSTSSFNLQVDATPSSYHHRRDGSAIQRSWGASTIIDSPFHASWEEGI